MLEEQLFPDLECAAKQWCVLPDQLMKCGFGCVIFVNDFQMLQLPAECLKTALLGLDYETKWMKCAEDKLVSLYFELFSLQTPPPPQNAAQFCSQITH